MLGGFVALTGVLGWGVARYLNLLFSQLFNASFDLSLLMAVVIGLLASHNIFGAPSSWLSRSMYVYGAILMANQKGANCIKNRTRITRIIFMPFGYTD